MQYSPQSLSPSGTRSLRSPGSPASSGIRSPRSRPRSPDDSRHGCFAHVRMTAGAKCSRYFKRLLNYRHMDFEFACWQMLYLLVAPQKVFKLRLIPRLHKWTLVNANFNLIVLIYIWTKDQWARDDPAFLVLLSLALTGSSVFFAIMLGLSFGGFVKLLLWVVFIDFIGSGLVIASVLWLVSNQFLRKNSEDDVEWGFAWDVHLNAFFPLLVMMHIIMPILYAVYMKHAWILSCFLGNTIWFLALAYYIYISFLGYTALGFLKYTYVLLYPITFIFIGCIALTTLGVNLSNGLVTFYHYRVA